MLAQQKKSIDTADQKLSAPDKLADLCVAPLPFCKPLQRFGFALAGGVLNFLDRRVLHNLVAGVDQGRGRALDDYWHSRSLAFFMLPRHVRVKILHQVNETYRALFAKQANKEIRARAHTRTPEKSSYAPPRARAKQKTVFKKDIPIPDISLRELNEALKPVWVSVEDAAAAAMARSSSSASQSTGAVELRHLGLGKFQVKFEFRGPAVDRCVSSAIETMIRARVLEDYLTQKKCQVSASTFEFLLTLEGHPLDVLFSREVQGLVEFSQHLKHNYQMLSTLERATFLTKYGLKPNPVRYFEKVQDALAQKLRKKLQSNPGNAFSYARAPSPESPVQARSLTLSQLTAEVLQELEPRATLIDLETNKLRLVANRIAKLARKTTITLDDLRSMLNAAEDPFEAVAAMVRSPSNEQVSSTPVVAPEPDRIEADASPENYQPEETYINREQRSELHGIFRQHGQLHFKEFKTVLERYLNTSFSAEEGPGSHGQFTRKAGEQLFTAQASSNIQSDVIRIFISTVLEETLRDLRIKPADFIEALRDYRKIRQ
jgi:hypothetical protein